MIPHYPAKIIAQLAGNTLFIRTLNLKHIFKIWQAELWKVSSCGNSEREKLPAIK
jgi:hypothetical protein